MNSTVGCSGVIPAEQSAACPGKLIQGLTSDGLIDLGEAPGWGSKGFERVLNPLDGGRRPLGVLHDDDIETHRERGQVAPLLQ
jgi:hypothetical protein